MAKANKYLDEEVKAEADVVEEPVEKVIEKKPAKSPKKTTKKGTVANCGLLNVRETPSTSARILKCIPAGTEITILGEEDKFYKTSEGFVMKEFIEC